jgi:hypothetical protein
MQTIDSSETSGASTIATRRFCNLTCFSSQFLVQRPTALHGALQTMFYAFLYVVSCINDSLSTAVKSYSRLWWLVCRRRPPENEAGSLLLPKYTEVKQMEKWTCYRNRRSRATSGTEVVAIGWACSSDTGHFQQRGNFDDGRGERYCYENWC